MLCPHGGHYRDECGDEALAGRWQMVTATCYADAAEREFRKENPDLDESSLLGSYLLPPGEKPLNPLVFDPARAAEEYAEHQKRMANL